LEDSIPATGKLRGAIDQAERVRIARRAAVEAKVHFFINAPDRRFLQNSTSQHDDAMVAEALSGAHVYDEAGADGLFAPVLRTSL